MTNTTKFVAPLWGAERMLGTNPIAIAFPGLEEPPIVIDMATSAVAYGKIEIAQRAGKPIPLGWAVDRNGAPTTDPNAAVAKLSPEERAVQESSIKGDRKTLVADSFIPATMAVIYLMILLYFKAIGGYKPVHIVPVAEQQASEAKAVA